MIKVYGRVAIEFEVDEKLFKENPDKALEEAVENGRARYDGGDSYLPEPWNEGLIEGEGYDFAFKGSPFLKYEN